MRRNELVVFDGDDTLWRTQELYDAAKAEFAELLRDRDVACPDAIALLDRIDAKAAEIRGFTIERFINSMLETYRRLCAEEGQDRDGKVESRIRDLATPLLGDYELYDDTLDVLKRLAARYLLVLATKGEPELQRRKNGSV
jgi:putative hydrolase of the HAD superfamily